MSAVEENFPRGGSHGSHNDAPGNRHLVFDEVIKKKKKKLSKKIEVHRSLTGPQPKLVALEDLSYKVMTEGMLVLGRVKEIYEHYIDVVLPGLTEGTVPITHVSEPYSQLLKSVSLKDDTDEELQPLSGMFFKGQFVTAQIWKIRQSDHGKHEISLSLDPRAIHSEYSHTTMAKKGLIITAAVRSLEEHGYVMDCGVSSLRCFLKKKDAEIYSNIFNGGRPLAIGQLVRCLVVEAKSTPSASNIRVTADPESIAKQETSASLSVDVQQLLPGMCFNLAVLQSMKGGIRANVLNVEGIDGFVHQNHIPSAEDSKSLPSIGGKFFGRLLYITPLAKTPYFSLLPTISKTISQIPKPSRTELLLKVGTVVSRAEVSSVSGKGLSLHLRRNKCVARGFVPLRRSGFNFKRAEEESSKSTLELIQNDFSVGGFVKCRILHYDCFSDVFICSMEKNVLDEKYFTLSDVSVGDVVPCVVQEISGGGIIAHVGMLTGFVPATHSSDVPLKHPEQKFQPGLEIKGRVLKIDLDKHRMILTFKRSLISCDAIITSLKSANIGQCYLGTVVALNRKVLYVSFFGGVRGILPLRSSTIPEGQKFSEGQLLKCYVTKKTETLLCLSLLSDPDPKIERKPGLADLESTSNEVKVEQRQAEVGHKYSVLVVAVDGNGLTVKVIDDNSDYADGLIPVFHLSDDIRLTSLLLNTYEEGSKIKNVWCYKSASKKSATIFSLRSSVQTFFESAQGRIARSKSLDAVAVGWILPCTVESIGSDHVLLQVPLPKFQRSVLVPQANICDLPSQTVGQLGLMKGQGIQAKVVSVSGKNSFLTLSCNLKHVWDGELETGVLHLLRYLQDQHRLWKHAQKKGDSLGSYFIGRKVKGTVIEKAEWGYIIELEDKIRGETTFFNAKSKNKIEIGTVVSGVVLYVDCVRKHVEISLSKQVCSTLVPKLFDENVPLIEPPKRLHGSVLLVTPEFILAQVKWVGRRGLAFIPTQLYPYMSSPLSILEPFFGLNRKLVCKRVWNEIIVCLPMEVVVEIQKREKQKMKMLEKLERKKEFKAREFGTLNGMKLLDPDEIKKEEEDDGMSVTYASEPDDNDIEIVSEVDADANASEADEDAALEDTVSDVDDSSNTSEPDEDVASDCAVNDIDISSSASETDEDVISDGSCLQSASRASKCLNEKPENPSPNDDSVANRKRKSQRLESDVTRNSKNEEQIEFEPVRKRQSKSDVAENCVTRTKGDSMEVQIENSNIATEHPTSKAGKTNSRSTLLQESSELRLKSPGFVWDIDPKKFLEGLHCEKIESSSDDDEDKVDDRDSKKKTRKKTAAERREAMKAEEERLQSIEKDLMDPNKKPTSCDDFDRLVLANPNSSAVWLQYMAFHMQATEIEKARAVAQRAIKTIQYREEQEKLNVWLGLLNLENLYGTQDNLSSTLHQALQYNDPYKVHAHMVRIYAESGKGQELDSEIKIITKKFKTIPGMWQEIGSLLMDNGLTERARKLLDNALPHLKNKQESTALVVQFALMEARHNNLERAKALLDSVLASYPQRVDVWCTYCDLLVKTNHVEEGRQLLERCVNLQLPARKMKTLFTKYLNFEETHGTQESQERVRQLAVNYVNQVAGEAPMREV